MKHEEKVLTEDKITKQQKYSIFGGYKSKNTLYVKLFNGKITLIKVEKWKMSGKSINDIQGYVGILTAKTSKKDNKPHYYIEDYSLSFANNFKYQGDTPLTTEEARRLFKAAKIDMSKFKEFEDAPNAVDLNSNPEYIDHSKVNVAIVENTSFETFIQEGE